ncbi:hypothetical protein FRB91_006049 [Serendipita sp. 411]|nr:hypothetical protein FRB91_006049 [Serendipita sp. 411]
MRLQHLNSSRWLSPARNYSRHSFSTTRLLSSIIPTKEVPVVATRSLVKLRDYQENCIEACINAFSRGITRIGVSMPTGAGKTTVFISLLHQLPTLATRPGAKNSLIIVNSIELALQAANQVKRMYPETTVEIEQGKKTASGYADVTVATYQTLMRGDRLLKFPVDRMKAIIVDEAHHAAAKSYLSILSYFDPKVGSINSSSTTESPSVPIIGFSATFGRHDGRALGSVFQEIVYHQDFLQMIKEQWLCTVRFTTVKANIDLDSVAINPSSGDFASASLAEVMNTDAMNSLVVRSWIERAGERKSTLVFCTNLAHVHDLTTEFRKRGVDARYIHSGTHSKERQQLLDDFRGGRYPVLVNCAILTEGADIPNIDCVIIARPTRSKNIFAQMIGRGMRLSPQTGKEDCHIIDFVDTHGRVAGTFSTPSLLGLDPTEIMPGATLEELMERKEDLALGTDSRGQSPPPLEVQQAQIRSVTYTDHDDPFSWHSRQRKEQHIKALSSFAWVPLHRAYILETLGKGSLRIEPLKASDGTDIWEVNFVAPWDRKLMTQLFGRPGGIAGRTRRLAQTTTLEDALAAAETFAKQKLAPGPLIQGLLRGAAWRRQPSTPAQREMIAKCLGINLNSDHVVPEKAHIRQYSKVHNRQDLKQLTKGAAADMITRMRSGVKGAYDKELKRRAREQKEQQKEDMRKSREVVRVGPLRA